MVAFVKVFLTTTKNTKYFRKWYFNKFSLFHFISPLLSSFNEQVLSQKTVRIRSASCRDPATGGQRCDVSSTSTTADVCLYPFQLPGFDNFQRPYLAKKTNIYWKHLLLNIFVGKCKDFGQKYKVYN